MKAIIKILIFSLISTSAFSQQSSEIDPKFVNLARYADLAAINTAISVPKPGMIVYNIQTKSNWYYNGVNWLDMTAGSVVAPLSLSSSSTTVITGTTSATGEGGMKGVTTNNIVGFGVWGLATVTTPSATTYGVYGQNNSTNANGVGVGGIHNGTGWGGYFAGTNALKTFGKTYLDGAVSITNANFLEFGKGLTKQEDNGKIAYNAFGEANTLSIVGGGIANDGSDRKIKMWANGGTIFNGGASFDKSVNIGNFDLEPIAKLQISSAATSEAPSIAIIDTAPDNQNGGILQFRNQTGLHRFDIQGLFGLQSLPIDSYLSFNKNGSPIMRLRGDGRLGLGVIDPSEKIDLVGNIKLDGEIKPNGVAGTAGQILSSNGDGTMKWDNVGSIYGQIIEVLPSIADTAALRTKGYKLMGNKTQEVLRTGTRVGNIVTIPNTDTFYGSGGELFFSAILNKLFRVDEMSNQITSFDLNDATFGTKQTFSTPNYDLTNSKALFTGTKILIYPYLIFDCATGTSSAFPTNTCSGITTTKSQVWTGTKLIMYGPTGGFSFTLATNTFACIETPNGNLYNPACSVTWTGSITVFYGGYITISGNKISVDGGVTYNPSSNVWGDVPAGGPRVHDHHAIWTGTEVLILGGKLDNSTTGIQQDNVYNPSTFTWNAGYTSNLLSVRTTSDTRSILSNNKIFLFNVNDLSGSGEHKLLKKYFNTTTKTWQSYTPPYSHLEKSTVTLPVKVNNSVYYFSSGNPRCPDGSTYAFQLETTSTPYIMPLWNANIFTTSQKEISNQYILAFGNLSAAWLYNADFNRWINTNATNRPSDRTGFTLQAIPESNKFLVWGGLNGASYLNNGAIYNAVANTWTPMSTANAPTQNIQGKVGNGFGVFWGTTDGKMYNISSNTWTTISTSNAPSVSGGLIWRQNKFVHSSTSGVKIFNPATNTWADGSSNDIAPPIDITELNNLNLYPSKWLPYDEDNFIVIDYENIAEIYNYTTKQVKFAPIHISLGLDEAQERGVALFKTSATKRILLGSLNVEGCEISHTEWLQFLDNTTSNVSAPLKIQTLVYKKQ